MIKRIFLALSISGASAASADDAPFLYDFDGAFDDATFAVESAILDQGLVIDYVSHVGDMLKRTGADVGSETEIFTNADIFLFCSAAVSRQVMEADPMNIAHCPYSIFVMERDGSVTVGYKDYPGPTMQVVEDLLQQIVAEAIDG